MRLVMSLSYQENRNTFIDAIRGACILAVILIHINIRIPFDQCHLGKLIPPNIFNILFRSGYYGVMIFFVVSGFLITSSIMNKWGSLNKIELSQFYRMRFARIAPCLLGTLIVLSMLHIASIKGFVITTTTLKHAVLAAITFHINWLEAKTGYLPAGWGVLWSLSIEEIFYLLFPIACLFIRKENTLKFMLIIFIIIGPFARSYFYSNNDIWSDHSYLSCMDGIAIGCLAALYKNRLQDNAKPLLIAGLILFISVFFFRHFISLMGLIKIGLNVTMLEIGIAFILISLQNKSMKYGFASIFGWFGKNSYEIYLTHMFVVIWLSQLFYYFNFPTTIIPLFYFLIIASAGIMGQFVAKYFSNPLNQYLRSQQKELREKNINEMMLQNQEQL